MKKLIASAFVLTFISFNSLQAGISERNSNNAVAHHADKPIMQEKVSVKPENLPDGIKKTVKGEAFSGWKIVSAFLITAADKTQYYELNVKNGSESARVKLDKDGNNVE